MTVTPEETLAVVVGVETYRAGRSWNLNGPALDACRFANWLHRQGVPKQNIMLLVSPLAGNDAEIRREAAGFDTREATWQAVRDVLVTRLRAWRSEYLILYWGGHGVMDTDSTRRLLYADASTGDERNLNLTAFLAALRSSTYSNHPRQLLIVDSCLNHAAEIGWLGLPDETFPHAGDTPRRDQWSLFAASPGERAVNDDARKTGLFSEVLREEITWPPDPDALRDRVRVRFEQLRANGEAGQLPSTIWYQSRADDERVVFGSPAARVPVPARGLGTELLDRAEFKSLRQILLGAPAVPSLRSIYREATRGILPIPANPDNLLDYIGALRLPVNATPLFHFLVRFAAAAQDPSTRERLDRWIRGTAPKYQVDVEELEELRDELRRTIVLVRLQPDPLDDGWQVTAWTYAGSEGGLSATSEEPWGPVELGELLSSQYAAFVDDFDADSGSLQLSVEFLVGMDMLDDDLESLTVTINGGTYAIGAACPVVVRSLERVGEHGWTEAWHAKWRELKKRGASYDAKAIEWVEEQQCAESLRLCAALACPPNSDRPEALQTAFAAGTPVAVWHRDTGTRPSRRAALEDVLGVVGLLDLPERVMLLRISARHPDAPPTHNGRDLVLLWDDPERIPPDLQWHTPTLRGAAP